MRHPGLRSSLYLVKNGVPFDVAFSLDDLDRQAWTIILGELDGQRFNFDVMSWERPS